MEDYKENNINLKNIKKITVENFFTYLDRIENIKTINYEETMLDKDLGYNINRKELAVKPFDKEILKEIKEHPHMKSGRLAKLLGKRDGRAIMGNLNALESKGLIEPSIFSSRGKRYIITEDGDDILGRDPVNESNKYPAPTINYGRKGKK